MRPSTASTSSTTKETALTRFLLTDQAASDLATESDFLKAERSADAAREWRRSIRSTCKLLGDVPGMGRPRPEYGPRVRAHPFRGYVIVYREEIDLIVVLRILSFRRDREAAALLEQLSGLGYQVRTRRSESESSGVWHQVLVGPYSDIAAARQDEARVRQLPGYADARLTSR